MATTTFGTPPDATRSMGTTIQRPRKLPLGEFPFNLIAGVPAAREVQASPAQVEQFRAFATIGDPLADALVSRLRQVPSDRALFEAALNGGLDSVADAPQELVAFFRSVETTPHWVDEELLNLGARTILRAGPFAAVPLAVSLMGGYLSARGVKPLVATGDFVDRAGSRGAETTVWWSTVIRPGALVVGSEGYRDALRVRLVHAYVRAAMNQRDDWDYAEWDHPINQVQLLGTHLLFSLVPLTLSKALGVRYSTHEEEAVLHVWRYIGWLMGIDVALLPATTRDAWRLFWLISATENNPDDDSRRLAGALLEALQAAVKLPSWVPGHRLPGRVATTVISEFCRTALGDENANGLDLPRPPGGAAAVAAFRTAMMAITATVFGAETLRRAMPGATSVSTRVGSTAIDATAAAVVRRFKAEPVYRSDRRAPDAGARAPMPARPRSRRRQHAAGADAAVAT